MVSLPLSQFCIWSRGQDGGLHGGRHLYTDSCVTSDSHVGNKGYWAFTVNYSGIKGRDGIIHNSEYRIRMIIDNLVNQTCEYVGELHP